MGGVFAPDGLNGSDDGIRQLFHTEQAGIRSIIQSNLNEETLSFFTNFMIDVENAVIAFATERIADQDLPSQKLLVMKRIN